MNAKFVQIGVFRAELPLSINRLAFTLLLGRDAEVQSNAAANGFGPGTGQGVMHVESTHSSLCGAAKASRLQLQDSRQNGGKLVDVDRAGSRGSDDLRCG